MGKKVGRPTKYNPEVMLPILADLAKEGAFMEQVPHALGISKQTLYDWLNPEDGAYAGKAFVDAIKEVEASRDEWLAKRLRDQIDGKSDGNASALIFALKNTIGWRDRIETDNKHEHKTDVTFTWGGDNDA